ncbi:MAG: hypothetical protein ACI8ZN_002116 [Bacteroidia bacterium]|jgi:hypothetical protein
MIKIVLYQNKLKKLLSLCFLWFFVLTGNAQVRFADIKVKIKKPLEGSTIQSPTIIDFTLEIVNNGPDTIFSEDTMFYTPAHYFSKSFIKRTRNIGRIVAPGDTIFVDDTIGINASSDRNPMNFGLGGDGVLCYGPDLGHGILMTEFQEERKDNQPIINLEHKGSGLGVDRNELNHKILLYPNPGYGDVYIRWLYMQPKEISIINTLGSKVATEVDRGNLSSNTLVIKILDASEGLYFIKITSKEGTQTIKYLLQ